MQSRAFRNTQFAHRAAKTQRDAASQQKAIRKQPVRFIYTH
jgi:hypothetical protein